MTTQIMNVVTGITADSASVQLSPVDPTLSSVLAAGGHAVLKIYNAQIAETVFAVAMIGAGIVQIVRDDSSNLNWQAGSFAVVESTSASSLTATVEAEYNNALTSALQTDGTVKLTLGGTAANPTALFGLLPSGVTAGTYGGMTVDAYGRITAIAVNWPQSALPVFNPAGPVGGAAATATTAAAVGYTPVVGTAIATGSNVQVAIQQVEAAVKLMQAAEVAEVQSVTAGSGITLSGTATNPVVGIAPSGIAAGTYAGLTINALGQVTAYSAPVLGVITVAGTLPVVSAYSGVTNTWTVGVNPASNTTTGVVQLCDPLLITAGTVTVPSSVITYQGMLNYFAANDTPINMLTAAVAPPISSLTQIYDTGTLANEKVTLPQATMFGTTGAVYSSGAGLGAARNVATITKTSSGVYAVLCATALPSGNYSINAVARSASAAGGTGYTPTLIPGSQTAFSIVWVDNTGTLADPPSWSFSVESF